MDTDIGALADIFVVGALVDVLKPSPPADVINKTTMLVGTAALHVLQERTQ
jgi:hypothetical protein